MLVIIDYNIGNIGSIISMVRKIGFEAVYSSDPTVIRQANKLILPGIGSYDKAMRELKKNGLIEVLNEEVILRKKEILGICLGAQILGNFSEEGDQNGLGWIDMQVKKFDSKALTVPHMGWNFLKYRQLSRFSENLNKNNDKFYFAHSYFMDCTCPENILGTTNYGFDFASFVQKDNIFGVQFHPEKSHRYGFNLLKKFIND